jgi:hypothetical protein
MNEKSRVQLFDAFKVYADRNGIGLQYKDDWSPWWDCFLAGALILEAINKEADA